MATIIDSDDSDEPEQLQYKVIVLGDGAVGKTSLAMRFTGDYCRKSYKQTIGVDFFLKHMVIPGDVQVGIQLWDIGGQTIGGKMIRNYIFGAQAVLLVYDITNYQSFVNLEDWLAIVRDTFGPHHMPYVGLVANKIDLKHMRAVSIRKHHDFADEQGMYSFTVSAKTGDGVAPCFLRVAADLAGVVVTQKDLDAVAKPTHQTGEEKRPAREDETGGEVVQKVLGNGGGSSAVQLNSIFAAQQGGGSGNGSAREASTPIRSERRRQVSRQSGRGVHGGDGDMKKASKCTVM